MKNRTLILGASLNPSRISHIVVKELNAKGFELIAFGRKVGHIGDVEVTDRLMPWQDIHTISLYLNPAVQKSFYQDIIDLDPKRVIFNPGTENPEFQNMLSEAGIAYENACNLVLLRTDQYKT